MIRLLLFVAALMICALYALRAGSRPERMAIFAQVAATLLTFFDVYFLRSASLAFSGWVTFDFPVWGWLITDLLLLGVLGALALRANRLWTLALAGLQLASMFAHVVKIFIPDQFPPLAYAILLQIWAWPMIAVTALGVRQNQKRRLQGKEQPDWKPTIHGWK